MDERVVLSLVKADISPVAILLLIWPSR